MGRCETLVLLGFLGFARVVQQNWGLVKRVHDAVPKPEHQMTESNSTASPVARRAYSIKETAAMLGLHHNSIRRLIDRGELRASRALRHYLIPSTEIDRFLKASTN